MGFGFRKRIKIVPGVNLNVGKRGASVSLGGKGATLNIGKKGVRSTVGIPGSGISYSSKLTSTKNKSTSSENEEFQHTEGRRVGVLLFIGILFMPYIFSWLLLRNGHTAFSRIVGFIWLGIVLFILATQ